MSYPNKEIRDKCYKARDFYWKCLDVKAKNECDDLRKLYENECPAQWVKHFDRKREYLKFKEKMEKEGYEPINEK